MLNVSDSIDEKRRLILVSMLRLFLIFAFIHLVLSSSDIILQPTKQGTNTVALIFIHGFGLPPERYIPLFKQVQLTSADSLWIAIPAFVNDIPVEETRPHVIDEMLTKLFASGMPRYTRVFLSGHSLGGITSQDLAIKYQNMILGQILIGSFLQLKYQSAETIYPISTLTLSGELDGLTGVTRIIESFYFYSTYPHFTVIIPGMNHMDPASGIPTPSILRNDTPSEIGEAVAHQQLAIRVCDYMSMRLQNQTITPILVYDFKQTKIFSQPYLDALNLEGSYHILSPCYNKTESKCQTGSPWSSYVQQIISGLNDTIQLNISDQFDVFDEPLSPFPRLANNCSTTRNNCTLYIHTFTENVYDPQELHSAAEEMRVKMVSRQILLEAVDGKNHDFNQTDGQSLCGLINQKAFDWAIKNAGNKTKDRYDRKGKQMIIGEDIGPFIEESAWIDTSLVRIYEIEENDHRFSFVEAIQFHHG